MNPSKKAILKVQYTHLIFSDYERAQDKIIHWDLLMRFSFLITTLQALVCISNSKIKRLKTMYNLAQKATFE